MELKRGTVGEGPGRAAASLKMLVADEYVLSVRIRNAIRSIYGGNVAELGKVRPRIIWQRCRAAQGNGCGPEALAEVAIACEKYE